MRFRSVWALPFRNALARRFVHAMRTTSSSTGRCAGGERTRTAHPLRRRQPTPVPSRREGDCVCRAGTRTVRQRHTARGRMRDGGAGRGGNDQSRPCKESSASGSAGGRAAPHREPRARAGYSPSRSPAVRSPPLGRPPPASACRPWHPALGDKWQMVVMVLLSSWLVGLLALRVGIMPRLSW
jgi:hypothetical protein